MPASRRRQATQVPKSVDVADEAIISSGKKKKLTSKGFQRHFAKHDYHDFARYQPTELDDLHLKPVRGGVQCPFPVVLHRMLEESKDFADVVSWQPHGRAFLIRQPKEFVATVLPKYFKHSKLSSFQRQLSLYGFIRLTHDGADRGAYYHEAFLRGREFLCSRIQRTRIKGTWIRTSSSPEEEPNFYQMEPVNDLNTTTSQAPSSNMYSNKIQTVSDEDSSANSAETPLQQPPQLASNVVRPVLAQELSWKSAPIQAVPSLASLQWPPKVVEYDNSAAFDQFFGLGSFQFPSMGGMNDTDLAHFLTGVDLDAELGMNDVVQMSSV